MKKDLRFTLLDDQSVFLSWPKEDGITSYAVVGMNELFVENVIKTTNTCQILLAKEDIYSYIKIGIKYIYQDKKMNKEIVIDSSNYLEINDIFVKKEMIQIHSLASYQGYSFSFVSEKIYDKYLLYEKGEKEDCFILESEDFQVTSKKIKPNKKYYVEAYNKCDNHYDFVAKSDVFVCKSKKVLCPKKKALSIIVPVYNGEVFLTRTLDSILFSTFQDKEIILIDDGSSEDAVAIMKWYEKKYPGIIRYYRQENKGISFARNLGIMYAEGEYTAFVDHDDIIHPYMYEKLYHGAVENHLDIVIGKTLIRTDIHEKHFCLDVTKDEDKDVLIYSFDEMFQEYDKNTHNNIFFVAVWNKIIRTEIVQKHPFPSLNYYEDTAFTMTNYSYIDTFGFCKSAYYVWDKRFRNTIGTATNQYKKVNSLELNDYYFRSLFFISENGNKERLSYLSYYSLVELYQYLEKTKSLDNRNFAAFYERKVKELHERIDLMNNPFIQNNSSLLTFVKNILNK